MVTRYVEDVAASLCPDRGHPVPGAADDLTNPADVDVDRVAYAPRRFVAPHAADQSLNPHRSARVYGECREDAALAGRTGVNRLTIEADLNRTEQLELHWQITPG